MKSFSLKDVSAVSAENLSDDAISEIPITDDYKLGDSAGSFNDLATIIENTENESTITLTQDYTSGGGI